MIDIKDTVVLVKQCQCCFLLVDCFTGFQLFTYEGRHLSNPKFQGHCTCSHSYNCSPGHLFSIDDGIIQTCMQESINNTQYGELMCKCRYFKNSAQMLVRINTANQSHCLQNHSDKISVMHAKPKFLLFNLSLYFHAKSGTSAQISVPEVMNRHRYATLCKRASH